MVVSFLTDADVFNSTKGRSFRCSCTSVCRMLNNTLTTVYQSKYINTFWT